MAYYGNLVFRGREIYKILVILNYDLLPITRYVYDISSVQIVKLRPLQIYFDMKLGRIPQDKPNDYTIFVITVKTDTFINSIDTTVASSFRSLFTETSSIALTLQITLTN